jgi:L-ornithine N5-oxygenase
LIESALDTAGGTGKPTRICVIGSGQSAAEVFIDVRSRLSEMGPIVRDIEEVDRHEIDLIVRKGSLKPSDDSPFSNEIFDPECKLILLSGSIGYSPITIATDRIYNLPTESSRKRLLAEFRNTNYGVVNPRTLEIVSDDSRTYSKF